MVMMPFFHETSQKCRKENEMRPVIFKLYMYLLYLLLKPNYVRTLSSKFSLSKVVTKGKHNMKINHCNVLFSDHQDIMQ